VISLNDDQQNDDGRHDGIGQRFSRWIMYTEPELTPLERAQAYEQWAAEFEAVPLHREPYAGWAKGLADSARRLARHHRGQPMGEPDAPVFDCPEGGGPILAQAQ
jgi:hypothetical protein